MEGTYATTSACNIAGFHLVHDRLGFVSHMGRNPLAGGARGELLRRSRRLL